MADKQLLIEMGFDAPLADKALKKANGNVQAAMDLLLQGQVSLNDDVTEKPADNDSDNEQETESTSATAQSLVCNQCQKQLRDANAAQVHATRTGHTDFSESTAEVKPLTEEEKAAHLALLRQRLAEKKAAQLEEEVKQRKQNEMLRRKKQADEEAAKEAMRERDRLAIIEQKKREKLEAAEAKRRIMAQIEADKADRAAKLAGAVSGNVVAAAPAPVAQPSTPAASNATSARIQVRFMDGPPPLQLQLDAKDNLVALFDAVKRHRESHQKSTLPSMQLLLSYPRKAFKSTDSSQTVADAGLLPSASLTFQA